MISASTVYDSCLALIKKDKRGRAFTVDEYNSISELVNMELFNAMVAKYENTKRISDELNPFKVRNHVVTLTAGVGFIPGEAATMAGQPWIAHPWGRIIATEEVDVKGYADTKVKITSADHGLKDGAVITATGLSVHTITSKPIFYIDKNSFWVDVDYIGADVLTAAAWTVVGASNKEVDLVTEGELSMRWADHLTKPTIQNPVYVMDIANKTDTVDAFGVGGNRYTGYPWIHVHDHGLKAGDIVAFYSVLDGGGMVTADYNAAVHGNYEVIYVYDKDNFVFDETYSANPQSATIIMYDQKRINVYPNTIPTVNINYLRYPKTPFLDFYTDANYVIHYLDAYTKYIYTSHPLALGEEYRDGTAGTDPATTIYSYTVDWEWDEAMLPQIVYMILLKAGINLENMNVAQIAAQLQTKEESQV